MMPDAAGLDAVMQATWPPAATRLVGLWTIREGQGGGQRVSAATQTLPGAADIAQAEAAMRALGQPPLFMLGPHETALDARLHAVGYRINDPVVTYALPLTDPAPAPVMTSFPHWPPLAITATLWAEAGTGPARLAIMQRAKGPKAVILARCDDHPAGVAFVACHGGSAMLHALEIRPDQRRKGAARHILQAAAHWAHAQGADRLLLAVTQANAPARALYASFGMEIVGQYHYRTK